MPKALVTLREREILTLLAAGAGGTPDIAQRLRCSVWTVRTHLRRLRRKTGTRTTLALLLSCIATGALPAPRRPEGMPHAESPEHE
jgi:DNA-binding CsgD family transcriptional regulator